MPGAFFNTEKPSYRRLLGLYSSVSPVKPHRFARALTALPAPEFAPRKRLHDVVARSIITKVKNEILMKTNEHITHEPGDSGAWVCICKNTVISEGFYPCNELGEEMEPVAGWNGLYVCDRCGRITHQDTLEVVGFRASADEY
jgi:hypothetical protein